MKNKTHGLSRHALSALVFAALLVSLCASAAQAEEFETLFTDPSVVDSEELYELLLYDIEVNTTKAGAERQAEGIALDGSGVSAYLTSAQSTPEYGVCLRWAAMKGEAAIANGHGCYAWYDKAPHTQTLLTEEQAKEADTLVLENFDVKGVPTDWAGADRPPGTLAHQRSTYDLLEPSAEAPAGNANLMTSMFVVRSLRGASKNILRCAHPTGKFLSMATDHFEALESGYQVDFTINYRCLVGKRACKMSMSGMFDEAGMLQDIKVLEDTAKTDATIGLKACKALLEVLKR